MLDTGDLKRRTYNLSYRVDPNAMFPNAAIMIKVGLSHSKKLFFIYFYENPLKMMKDFYLC